MSAIVVGAAWTVVVVGIVLFCSRFNRRRASEALRAGYMDATPPAPKVSPLVEPLTVVGDLLCILENENLHAAEEEMDPFVSARLLEYAARVQVARQVVAELRDVKAGATL